MRRLVQTALILVGTLAPAQAFETATQAALDRLKPGKPVSSDVLSVLMRTSERWCYFEADGKCRWSDIYLEVSADGARFELSNAWDSIYDIAFLDRGVFREGRYFCEVPHDWVPSLRATDSRDGRPIGGRELEALRLEIAAYQDFDSADCFDYELTSIDLDAKTVTLLQRHYKNEATDPSDDAPVTVHFDVDSAAALDLAY